MKKTKQTKKRSANRKTKRRTVLSTETKIMDKDLKAVFEQMQETRENIIRILDETSQTLKSTLPRIQQKLEAPSSREQMPKYDLRQRKGKKDRIVWLNPDALDLLRSWRERRSQKSHKLTEQNLPHPEVKVSPPIQEQLLSIRKGLGLSRVDLANILHCSPKSIQDWERNRSAPRQELKEMRQLSELAERLKDQFSPAEVRRWMKAPNKLFGMKKPVDLLRKGKISPLLQIVGWIEDGTHS
jgi:DNA-binding transcriptional regulator YiaG